MSNEISKTAQNLSPVTIDEIRKYICPTATESELNFAFQICKSTGLNPFLKELHIIKYGNNPAQIVTSYLEYIKRAERSGKLNGWSVKLSEDKRTATCVIHRKDWSQPFEWEVDFNEANRKQSTWSQIPMHMLKKTAICQAFRLCFPDEIACLPYSQEEQETINVTQQPTQQQEVKGNSKTEKILNTLKKSEVKYEEPKEKIEVVEDTAEYISREQQKLLFAKFKESGMHEQELRNYLHTKYGDESTTKIKKDSFEAVLDYIDTHKTVNQE